MHALGLLPRLADLSCSEVSAAINATMGHVTALRRLVFTSPDPCAIFLELVPETRVHVLSEGEAFGMLSQLSLYEFTLTSAPICLQLMPCLTRVEFQHCDFEGADWLAEALTCATQIKRLNMSFCQLTGLPGTVCQMHRLETLKLNCNFLTDLPMAISCLTSLQALEMVNCKLEHVPFGLEHLTSLQRIEMVNSGPSLQFTRPLLFLLECPKLEDVAIFRQFRDSKTTWNALSMYHIGQLESALDVAFADQAKPNVFSGQPCLQLD